MSQVDELIAHLMQIRDRLAPLSERLLDIEARMVAARVVDQRPASISLREFTAHMLGHEGLRPSKPTDCHRAHDGLADVG